MLGRSRNQKCTTKPDVAFGAKNKDSGNQTEPSATKSRTYATRRKPRGEGKAAPQDSACKGTQTTAKATPESEPAKGFKGLGFKGLKFGALNPKP